jgi:glycosyltransferase involved in cell wall biosynthesis
MKLLVVSGMFPSRMLPQQGIFFLREAEYLSTFGIECQFLVPGPWAPWPLYKLSRFQKYGPQNPFLELDKFNVQRARYLRPSGKWFRPYAPRAAYLAVRGKARRLHREVGFDAVLGFPLVPDAEVAVRVGLDLNLPVAAMAIGSDVMVYPNEQGAMKKTAAWVLERLDLAVGVSRETCRTIAALGNCKREPLCVYLGRDTNKFVPAKNKAELRQKLGIDTESIVGVYVGNLIPTKGIPELAKACETLFQTSPQFKLIAVGQGPSKEVLKGLNIKTGREAVLLPGCVLPEEVPAYLQAADFLVFPSHSEGMPQAVLEAMNCGLSVIATPVGGIPEAVIDNETGILVPVHEVGKLQAAIERMIIDEPFRKKTAANALQRSHESFDPLNNAEKLACALMSIRK